MKISRRLAKWRCLPIRGQPFAWRTGEHRRRGESRRAFLGCVHAPSAGLWVIQGLCMGRDPAAQEPMFDKVSALHGTAVIFSRFLILSRRLACGWRRLGRRNLASECDRADLRCSWSAGLLFDVLDCRRSRLDRYLFRLDLAAGHAGTMPLAAQALIKIKRHTINSCWAARRAAAPDRFPKGHRANDPARSH